MATDQFLNWLKLLDEEVAGAFIHCRPAARMDKRAILKQLILDS
jgi:hypothetical protein